MRDQGASRRPTGGLGLAFPPLVRAGCVPGCQGGPLVLAVSVGPGSIGFDLTPHWQDELGSTKYEPQ
ncbi:hypothetical protein FH715_02635 [Streptomyces sedi]|uniref:Uncharacterized protein n=1 Tax=Streptomyces sedi TaxID=555059 RepID=A0A5C4VFV9_9ACTN|nr:hypothetical protein FH715_02635 [Streptomyces sedi]